ncbi:MAG: hypothetical protein LBQ79_05855, partial [Deltaproteobacteria bacterium]|nr:hypothetical protein [Deltaproteobacteria bacterium]
MSKDMSGYFRDRRISPLPGFDRYDDPLRGRHLEKYMKTPLYDFQLFVLPVLPELAQAVSSL